MAERPHLKLSGIVLDSADPHKLAAFYQRLLGWTVIQDEPGWIKLGAPDSGPGLSFQEEKNYVPPVWPAGAGEPQMAVHLDIQVEDLNEAGAHAEQAGATMAEFQPQDDVRVFLDPAGHPFCLCVN